MMPPAPKPAAISRWKQNLIAPTGPEVLTSKEAQMADLIAIGYPDETTALSAMDEAERLQKELIIQADAVAAIIRNKEGKIRVVTNHHAVGAGATWGMFWGMLFGMLFFVPFLGMAVGAGMGALMGKVTKSAVDKQFQDQAPRRCSWWSRRSPRTRPSTRCRSTAAPS
jgi:Protein of unknown function (DUF1269)